VVAQAFGCSAGLWLKAIKVPSGRLQAQAPERLKVGASEG